MNFPLFLTLFLFSIPKHSHQRCEFENPDGSLDGRKCRNRKIDIEEIEEDCLTYYSDDISCFLHHISQYYCCYNYVEYDDGTIEDRCYIWWKPEIDDDAVFDSVKDYKENYGVSGKIILDCKCSRNSVRIEKIAFLIWLLFI